MAVQSPSYPSLSLASAIEAVGKIEGIYRKSPVDRENAAKLLGYSGLSGPANMTLAALASYGLVERAGKGAMRVTPLARSILHPENDAERRQSLMIAASSPKLFGDIWTHFDGHKVPPEAGVVNYLNRQGFNPSAVPKAAKAFLQTARLVEELSEDESHGAEEAEPVRSSGVGSAADDHPPAHGARRKRQERPGMKEDVYTLPEGDVVLQWPDRLSQASFEEIEDWTRLMLRKLKRQVAEQPSRAEGADVESEDKELADRII